MLSTVVLLGLTSIAAVTDLLWGKIFNWNTYGGVLAALVLSAAGSVWLAVSGTAPVQARWWHWVYWQQSPLFWDSVSGLFLCGGLILACFLLFPGVSGGDVKLMAMVGALLGVNNSLEAFLWTFALAACFGLIFLVWRIGPWTTVSCVVRAVGCRLRLPWLMPLSVEEHKGR